MICGVEKHGIQRSVFGLLIVCVLSLLPARAQAIDDVLWISPGVKLAYTFGYGFTFGLEVSLVWVPRTVDDLEQRPVGLGAVLNLTTEFDKLFIMRLGAQATGVFFGLETGPSLVVKDTGTYFGFGLTPWVSSYCIPFYTYTLVFADTPNLHEFGVYLKVHLNSEGDMGSHDDFD